MTSNLSNATSTETDNNHRNALLRGRGAPSIDDVVSGGLLLTVFGAIAMVIVDASRLIAAT